MSTVITGMLIKFGGAALALLAGSVVGTAQATGASAGRIMIDSTSPVRSDLMPTASWANAAFREGGITNLASGMIEKQSGDLMAQARVGNMFGAEKIAKAGFIREGSSIAKTLMVDDRIIGNLQKSGFSKMESMAVAGAFGFDPQKVGGFMLLRGLGMVSGDTIDQIIQASHYGTKTQALYPGAYGTEIGGISYIETQGGNIIPIESNLGQLNVKSEATKQAELIKQAKEGKALDHDYAKMVKFALGQSAISGVDNTTVEDFVEQVSKEASEKIRHSDSLKQFLRSQTDQEVYASISGGGSLYGIVKAGAGYKVSVKTSSGEIKEFEVSHEFGEELRKIQSNSFREAVTNYTRNETNINKLKEWAMRANAKDFAEYLDVVKGVEAYRTSDSIAENVQFTAFTAGVFSHVLGRKVDMPESAAYIRQLAASSNPEDQKLLTQLLENYSFQRIYYPQIMKAQNNLTQKIDAIEFQYQRIKGETELMANKEVPKVADPYKILPQVNQEEFRQRADSVQTGLDNKKQTLALLQLPLVGPLMAAPYNYGQYLTTTNLMPPIVNELGLTRWGNTPIFSTTRDIYFKEQVPFNPTITEAVMPIMFTSSQEAERRWDSLRENVKSFVIEV